MAEIHKKIWPEYFGDAQSGKKKFELRLADFDLKEGDTLVLEEWDPKTKKYTGRKIEKTCACVTKLRPLTQFWTEEQIKKNSMYVIELK